MAVDWNKLKDKIINESPFQEIVEELIYCISQTDMEGKYHPLGFYSFYLAKLNEKDNLRLHIWKNTELKQSDELMIHNHIFNFKSLVLLGTITNYTYDLEFRNEFKGVLYQVEYTPKSSKLKKSKSGVKLSNENVKIITKGQYYHADFKEFHKSEKAENSICATILLTENVSEELPLVYSPFDFGEELEYLRTNITKEKQSQVLRELIKELSK